MRFTIDDFGTGYSSFSYLTKLPVKSIKIDKSFVLGLGTDRDNALIVRSIIDLSHNLGLKVVAEGVETATARDMLKSFGCDEAQGYYYSRPQLSRYHDPLSQRTATRLKTELVQPTFHRRRLGQFT